MRAGAFWLKSPRGVTEALRTRGCVRRMWRTQTGGPCGDAGRAHFRAQAAGGAAQVNEYGAGPGEVGVDALRVRDRAGGRSRVSAPGLVACNGGLRRHRALSARSQRRGARSGLDAALAVGMW